MALLLSVTVPHNMWDGKVESTDVKDKNKRGREIVS